LRFCQQQVYWHVCAHDYNDLSMVMLMARSYLYKGPMHCKPLLSIHPVPAGLHAFQIHFLNSASRHGLCLGCWMYKLGNSSLGRRRVKHPPPVQGPPPFVHPHLSTCHHVDIGAGRWPNASILSHALVLQSNSLLHALSHCTLQWFLSSGTDGLPGKLQRVAPRPSDVRLLQSPRRHSCFLVYFISSVKRYGNTQLRHAVLFR